MKPISLTAVEYLCLNMREMDRREVYGMRGHDSPLILAREIIHASCYGKAAMAEYRGKPAAIIGVSPLWPGVWSIWSFGTDDWSRVAIEVGRYGKRVLEPFVRERGAHRVQCESHIEHTDAHRWLTALGAEPDGLLRGYGRDGSDYIMFSWSSDYVHRKAAKAKARA